MMKELSNILDREILRAFMEEEIGQRIDDETLDMIIIMLQGMIRGGNSNSSRQRQVSRPQQQRQITYTPNTPLLYRPQTKQRSGCCCCIL